MTVSPYDLQLDLKRLEFPRSCPQRYVPSELHAHTTFTDGRDDVESMLRAAVDANLQVFGFAEHVNRSTTYWPAFMAEVHRIRPRLPSSLEVHTGIEVKALDLHGTLDLPAQRLDGVDFVVGSVHSYPRPGGGTYRMRELTQEAALDLEFGLTKGLIESSPAHIIGHMGATVAKYFSPFSPEQRRELLDLARRHQRVVEFSARYHDDAWLTDIISSGVRFVASSDAHAQGEVGRGAAKILQRIKALA